MNFLERGNIQQGVFREIILLSSSIMPVSPGCALFRRRDVEDNLIVEIPNMFEIDFPVLEQESICFFIC